MNPKTRKVDESKGSSAVATGASANNAAAALARAVSLHLEGKRREALQELKVAISNGGDSAELFSAIGHIQFELEQYEDAAKSYTKLLSMDPKHAAGNFNIAVCFEKLGRWNEAADRFKRLLRGFIRAYRPAPA